MILKIPPHLKFWKLKYQFGQYLHLVVDHANALNPLRSYPLYRNALLASHLLYVVNILILVLASNMSEFGRFLLFDQMLFFQASSHVNAFFLMYCFDNCYFHWVMYQRSSKSIDLIWALLFGDKVEFFLLKRVQFRGKYESA